MPNYFRCFPATSADDGLASSITVAYSCGLCEAYDLNVARQMSVTKTKSLNKLCRAHALEILDVYRVHWAKNSH